MKKRGQEEVTRGQSDLNNTIDLSKDNKTGEDWCLKLVEKDVSFNLDNTTFTVQVSNRMTAETFSNAVGTAVRMLFSREDDTYEGYMTWAHDFAIRVAAISLFTNVETESVELGQLWFFVYYSPTYDIIKKTCPEELSLLIEAVNEAIELKKDYLIRKSDWINLFAEMLKKIDNVSEGFNDVNIKNLSSFLNNFSDIQGGELIQGILNGLGDIFNNKKEEAADIPETIIGSQRQDKRK